MSKEQNMSHTYITAPCSCVEQEVRHAACQFLASRPAPTMRVFHRAPAADGQLPGPGGYRQVAANREVICSTTPGWPGQRRGAGRSRTSVTTIIRALGISQADVLGFSIGGYIAQTLTLRHPELVRRLVLVGTGPRAGEFEGQDPKIYEVAGQDPDITEDGYLFLFFEPIRMTSQQVRRGLLGAAATSEPSTSTRRARCRSPRPRPRPWANGASRLVSGGQAEDHPAAHPGCQW